MIAIPSLLANVSIDDVIADPLPHVLVKNVLEDEPFQQLMDEYPSLEVLAERRPDTSSSRLNCSEERVFTDDATNR